MRRSVLGFVAAVALAAVAVCLINAGHPATYRAAGGGAAEAAQMPSSSQRIAQAASAYPALAARAPEPAPNTLPTIRPASAIVAAGTIKSKDIHIAVTDQGEMCVTAAGSSTCHDAGDAAKTGVFMATIDCANGSETASLTGVVPAGVTRVTAGGVVGGVASDGAVTITVPGGKVDNVHLDNGQVSQLLLTGTECSAPKGQAVPARPAG
jgi:hypothetical protein